MPTLRIIGRERVDREKEENRRKKEGGGWRRLLVGDCEKGGWGKLKRVLFFPLFSFIFFPFLFSENQTRIISGGGKGGAGDMKYEA